MQVIKAPHKILRAETKPIKKITPSLLQTVEEMIKLAKSFKDPEGVGLAATQIGKREQFFVAKRGDDFIAVFNPKIIAYSKRMKTFFEGCLSIPDYYGEIKRPAQVKVEYMNKDGKIIRETLKGVDAWIFQHEYDHLHGRLFMDYVLEQKAKLFKAVGKDPTGADIFQQVEY